MARSARQERLRESLAGQPIRFRRESSSSRPQQTQTGQAPRRVYSVPLCIIGTSILRVSGSVSLVLARTLPVGSI